MTATAILDLERVGFTRDQVEALARWQETQTVSKADLAGIEVRLVETEGRPRGEIASAKFDTIKRVIGVGVVQIGSLIGVAYAILRLFPGAHP